MARIKIRDLAEDLKVSREDLKRVRGGGKAAGYESVAGCSGGIWLAGSGPSSWDIPRDGPGLIIKGDLGS